MHFLPQSYTIIQDCLGKQSYMKTEFESQLTPCDLERSKLVLSVIHFTQV